MERARVESARLGKGIDEKGTSGVGHGWEGHDFSRAIKTIRDLRLQPLRFALRPATARIVMAQPLYASVYLPLSITFCAIC